MEGHEPGYNSKYMHDPSLNKGKVVACFIYILYYESCRYAKTQLEAKTLQSVREELTRLDSVLSRDVTILRNRIEEATRQYSAARYVYTYIIPKQLYIHIHSPSAQRHHAVLTIPDYVLTSIFTHCQQSA